MIAMMALVPSEYAELAAKNGIIHEFNTYFSDDSELSTGGTLCLPGRLIQIGHPNSSQYDPNTLYHLDTLNPQSGELIKKLSEAGKYHPVSLKLT